MKKYIPFCSAESIFDIDLDFFKKIGVKYLFIDLDNTLDSPHTEIPSERVIQLFKKMVDFGLIPVITSNNTKERVALYASILGVRYMYRTCKPFVFRLKDYIKSENITNKSVIIIGDQIVTDIICANRLKVKSILTNPLVEKELLVTVINRHIDCHYRKKIRKTGLVCDWREIYAKLEQS